MNGSTIYNSLHQSTELLNKSTEFSTNESESEFTKILNKKLKILNPMKANQNTEKHIQNPEDSIYNIRVKEWNGVSRTLRDYEGFTMLIVNVASDCGLAKCSYEELSGLDARYYRKGLRILLFPCRQFLSQEFKEITKVKEFIDQFSSRFILMDYVDVKGPNIHPLYKHLTDKSAGFITNGIKWNFTYFLISPSGEIVRRYGPMEHVNDGEGGEILECLKNSIQKDENLSNFKVEYDGGSSESDE